jgi:DNA polymerase-3 subunit delta'
MSLKEIFCQDKAIAVLQRALAAGKVPHAYIFAGREGIGKFKTAHEWAKVLLCENPVEENGFTDNCALCRSCRLFEAGSHPDFNSVYKELVEFTRDGKGKKTPVDLPIDVIREFLIEKVSIKPTLSKRKVFVVSEAERLNVPSQNSLLKVLEEPPEYCFIILLCTRMEKLLATIKSRCQMIRLAPIAEDRIIEKLTEMGIEQRLGRYFARLAQGSLGRACQWAQLEISDANLYKTKKQLLNSLAKYEYAGALDLAQWLLDESNRITTLWSDLDKTTSRTDINRRARKAMLQIIISALHDVMKLNVIPAEDLINFEQEGQIQKLAGRFRPEEAAEKIDECYSKLRWIESGVNEKLIFEQLLLNFTDSGRIKVH